jgi:restriction endonuclease S subunit
MIFYKETNFKETPVGTIPRDWDIVNFASMVNILKGYAFSSEFFNEKKEGLPLIRIRDLGKNETECYYSDEYDPVYIVRKGDILISMDGEFNVYSWNGPEGLLNQRVCKVSSKEPEKLDNNFLFYALQKPIKIIESQISQTTVKHLLDKDIERIKIPFPPLEEQRAVAGVLGVVDSVIAKTDEDIVKTERLKKGLMQELLTKGLILGFMFDTNIFDEILDKKIELPENLKYYVSHIQYDEILNIPIDKKERKEKLLKIFNKVPKEVIATEGSTVGVSKVNSSKVMSKEDTELYNKMLEKLKELDEKSGKKKTSENQAKDILIALTSIKNCLILVTEDKNLKKVTEEFNGQAITFEQFQKREYREFKDTEIGRIPKHWKVVKLSDKAEVVSGFGFPLDYQGKRGGKYLFIKVNDLNSTQKYVITADNFIDDEDLKALRAEVFPPNTIIFPKIGMTIYLNKFRILKTWGTFDNNIAGVIPKEINSEFLFYYFQGKIDLKQLSGRTTAPSIRKTTLESILIPYPPLQEQQKIAEILSTIDKKLEVEKNEKAKLEKIKQGLMDLLLTGKIRVKI